MITVVIDNLDGNTFFVSYSFYGGDVYRKIYESDNVLYEEFDDIKRSPFLYSESRGYSAYRPMLSHWRC